MLTVTNPRNGMVFKVVDEVKYVRLDGSDTYLKVWESNCRECGKPFQIRTPWHTIAYEHSKAFGAVHCKNHVLPKDHFLKQKRR
jgi:hypothetical protein